MRVLAIDQGTTSTRALILDEAGMRLVHSVEHQQIYPAPGLVEHDPEELITNLVACLGAAPEVDCVGLANQGESCLAWDADTKTAISPVIVWQDARTASVCDRLKAEGAETLTLERAGLPLDPYFSATKLGWIVENIPQAKTLLAQNQLRLGTTDAFFRDRLTGEFATDPTTASRTSLLNLSTLEWDPELCAMFGVPIEALPPIRSTTGALGNFSNGLPLTASIVDQQAALFGHGARNAGDAKITFGTGAFALTLTDRLLRTPGVLPTIAWVEAGKPPVYALDGGVYAASSAVNFARQIGLFSSFDEINHFDTKPAIARGLAFVPALAGLACPHWDRNARGAWMGLSLDTSKTDMMQAVLEGVAFRVAEVKASMANIAGKAGPISIDGGMSQNPWFCQFLADVLGSPVLISQEPELTALGCAQLAARGAGDEIERKPTGRLLQPRDIPAYWAETFRSARESVQQFGAAVASS
ncbi:glycerol kinase (plasmid) [Neorhizobium sp. SOG26]|uniref:FGGY family carbohydrate kinase n=1 Tax=Neorhizobium sp. SOG26 TaxID=2060726 RepID=UPI000E57CA5C|nr:FGGY family carbohydrate kinase [Neorhizobium sp. SOG26]AXV17640.1 glycerol kinase [Neorhizobium sp. SOG26]